jgi:hypothetical protein
MPSLSQETLEEAFKSSKKAEQLLRELFSAQIEEEGEAYNQALRLAYGSSCKLVMDIETCINAQLEKEK